MPTLLGNPFVWYNLFHIGCLVRQCRMNKRIPKKRKRKKKKWVRKSKEHKRRWQVLFNLRTLFLVKWLDGVHGYVLTIEKNELFQWQGEDGISSVFLCQIVCSCQTHAIPISVTNKSLFCPYFVYMSYLDETLFAPLKQFFIKHGHRNSLALSPCVIWKNSRTVSCDPVGWVRPYL